jgi:beta-1,2-mannobiose phosphorylase / 1,2-beta-oligomannan phosphorylase
LCRIDGVNNYIAFSDNINVWREATLLQQPQFPWELVQIGNCGSPIETEEGWLVITHGVGPVREYVLGISLLDLNDPTKVIGRLPDPLIIPNEKEREGYVPNVVYSCGSVIHNGHLIIPYAMSDHASTYATVDLAELLAALKEPANSI